MLAIKALELVIAYIIISQKLAHFYCLGITFLINFCVNLLSNSLFSFHRCSQFRFFLFLFCFYIYSVLYLNLMRFIVIGMRNAIKHIVISDKVRKT